MKGQLRLLALVMVACVLGASSAFAQGGGATSSIVGTVIDPQGSAVPGATATAKNDATASEYVGVSNERGEFTIPAVDIGTYTVTISLMGFKPVTVKNVVVTAGGPAQVSAKLEVGGLEEVVVVEGGASIIQTQSAAVSQTIDANQVLKLPTGSRNGLNFITTLAGVNTPADSRDSTINGLPQGAINITIDGMSAQDNHLKTTDGFFARVSPRLDSVEQVTVSTAAQGAATTGQGAAQVQFTTRSGTNQLQGSTYFYYQHWKLAANSWFNNRDAEPDPLTGKAPKDQDIVYQPGTRVGGPITIPGLWNGRDRAFFFFNYEEFRQPGQNSEDRVLLHPRAQQGFFRYEISPGNVREIDLLGLAAANGHTSTIDPVIGRLLSDIRQSTGELGISDVGDPITQQYRYQYDTESITRYPSGRLDFNLTSKHKLTGSFNYNRVLITPDAGNGREPAFPGFPGTGAQHSQRYTVQTTLRSAFTNNLVNEFRIGGSGGPTKFSPEITVDQFLGTTVADQGGFLLDINGDFLGVTNAHSTANYQGREGTTRVLENTLSYIKGSHNLQMGAQFTRADAWVDNQRVVPTITFGVNASDPAEGMFSTANFPGASAAQLNDARELYATLVGRVIGIAGDARIDAATDEYRYLGLSRQQARLEDLGLFIADTWRWKPTLTVNYGLRYQLQRPFRPLNNSYSNATMADVCGVSGVAANGSCNLFQPGFMPGQTPQFVQFEKGEGAYEMDWNNLAPSLGFAWTTGGAGGVLGSILGRESGDSVLRGGYAIAYDRPGTADFTGGIDDNVGLSISTSRTIANGLLGTPGSILLRNTADLGPAPFPATRVYPMTDLVTEDVHIYSPNLQTPYSQTWSAGWQRKLTSNMAMEARYVGTRALHGWTDYDYNELNIVENGFLDEFRLAQQNLQAHVAAGCGTSGQPACSFAYRGPGTGTAPLPIFLAYFTGRPADQAGSVGSYTGTLWTSGTFRDPMAVYNPQPFTAANALDADAQRRQNALTAGLPANFLVANPHALGGAEVTSSGSYTRYDALQLELRRRLSSGFQFNANYTYGKAYASERYSFRTPRAKVPSTGVNGGVTHAFKGTWVAELPFGRGRHFLGDAPAWLDRLVGGWEFDGIATVQTGRELDFGNVRLVGMSVEEFQDAFELNFDHAGKIVRMLPQDIIDNTIKAWSVSATSASGYGSQGAPSGRYIAPANGPDCIEIAQTNATNGFGDCGDTHLVVRGPRLVRFDLSAVKRTPIKGRLNFEFRAELLNAFNSPWLTPVTGANNNLYNNLASFNVTDEGDNRQVQLVFRVNW